MNTQIVQLYGHLLAAGLVFLAVAACAAAVYVGVRRVSGSLSASSPGSGLGAAVSFAVGDAAAPLARAIYPEAIINMVRVRAGLDPNAERLGPHRLLGLTTSVGVASAAVCGSLLYIGGWKTSAALSVLIAPGFVAIALLELRSLHLARQKAIRRDFPYALDLLVLLCRAGASPAIALARVALDRANSPLGRELSRALRSINMGTTRGAALQEMAERVDVAEVSSFVATLAQAEQLGRPIADAMEQFADRVRLQRIHAAEAAAGSAGVKIMGPAVIVLVATLLLLLGPFFLKILRDGLPF